VQHLRFLHPSCMSVKQRCLHWATLHTTPQNMDDKLALQSIVANTVVAVRPDVYCGFPLVCGYREAPSDPTVALFPPRTTLNMTCPSLKAKTITAYFAC
jgi:hypothetical protein